MIKKTTILLVMGLVLTGCSTPTPDDQEIPGAVEVVGGGKGNYLIKLPFKTSPLRQVYANNYREADVMEIGRGLQENSKDVFAPDKYYLGEGSFIDATRYYELTGRESDKNIYGLNPAGEFTVDNTVIPKPVFVSDIVEVNFHKSKDSSAVDGASFALVLKRIQTTNPDTGAVMRMNDEDLYDIGVTLAQKLHSYVRTLEGAADIPIYIALYVQESDEDRLPGKYLPGYFIGHATFESSRNGKFDKLNDQWFLLSSNQALNSIPDVYASHAEFSRNLKTFMGDENIGIVGKAFVSGGQVKQVVYEINTGSKTYLELHGLSHAIKSQLSVFDSHGFPINIKIQVFQNTRIIISKDSGKEAIIREFN